MDFDDSGTQINIVILVLFITSGASFYLLVTAISSVSISSDVAGLGTFKGISTVSGQCEYITATSKTYSTGPVSNALWGASQFFTETDQLRYTFYSGPLSSGSCGGSVVTSYVISSPVYPITPEMINLACGNLPKSCTFYPKNIFTTYNSLYVPVMSGTAAPVPLFQGTLFLGTAAGISPVNVVTWEAIST